MKLEELKQAVRHCINNVGCEKCQYFNMEDCTGVMLQNIHDFLAYHEALLKEAERKAEEDGNY